MDKLSVDEFKLDFDVFLVQNELELGICTSESNSNR